MRYASVYGAFLRASFQQQLAYRVANWAGLFTNVFFLFLRVYVMEAAYQHREAIGGLNVLAAASYVTLTQAILMVVPQWGNLGLGLLVRSGDIAMSLLRPVDFYLQVMAHRLGASAYYAIVRMPPLLAIGWAGGALASPHDLVAAIAFPLSVVLGAWIAVSILFLVEVSSFWLESERGMRMLVAGVAQIPSGLILPIAFFPEPLQWVFLATPFPWTMSLPAEIWIGRVQGPALIAGLGAQLGWAIALSVACRWSFARGARHLQVVGG